MKFKIDDCVLYCPFPDVVALKGDKVRVIILEVLDKDDFYDYRVYVDDGRGRQKKVKEEKLEYNDENR
jgi:hypothetical protein